MAVDPGGREPFVHRLGVEQVVAGHRAVRGLAEVVAVAREEREGGSP
ncbi:hypothetical protein [Halobaculum litoreum]|nr:hypothetical protein [Halobaculum sp. DT92]